MTAYNSVIKYLLSEVYKMNGSLLTGKGISIK